MSIENRRISKANRVGMAPGSLLDDAHTVSAQFQLIHYREHDSSVLDPASLQAMQTAMAAHDGVTWLHVQGLPKKTFLEEMGGRFGLHPLLLEDIQSRDQRPKLDEYAEHLFAVLSVPRWQGGEVVLEQFSLLLGEGFVISIHDAESDITGVLRARLAQSSSRLRQHGADYLFYSSDRPDH